MQGIPDAADSTSIRLEVILKKYTQKLDWQDSKVGYIHDNKSINLGNYAQNSTQPFRRNEPTISFRS